MVEGFSAVGCVELAALAASSGLFPGKQVHNPVVTVRTAGVGDPGGGGTPGSISNPTVKPASADGTGRDTSWERRSLPTPCPAFSFRTALRLCFLFPTAPDKLRIIRKCRSLYAFLAQTWTSPLFAVP